MAKSAVDKLDEAVTALQESGQTLENRKEFWASVDDYWSEQARKVGLTLRRTSREPTKPAE